MKMCYTPKFKCKIIRHMEVNDRENLDDLEFDDDSSDITPTANQSMREKIGKLHFIKFKNFSNEQLRERKYKTGRKYLQKAHYMCNGLVSKKCKELLELNKY